LAIPLEHQYTQDGLAWLMGCDETGPGELLGLAGLAGVALQPDGAPALDELAGHVDTKAGRAASGWEALDERLRGLLGLRLVALPIPNRLFDAWSKNGLLDLAYVRLVNDLLAAAGRGPSRPEGGLGGVELAIDDYGAGELLTRAISAWRGDGAHVVLQHRADDEHLAARAASVLARAARAREFEGLKAEAADGPLGTGNAGNPATLRWMRRRAAAAPRAAGGGAWPSFVKASFRTARDLVGLPEVEKRRGPPPHHQGVAGNAQALVRGRFDITRASFRCGGAGDVPAGGTRRFTLGGTGLLLEPRPSLAWELLPLLVGGVALSDELEAAARRDPALLDALLDRERGLLTGWRVLLGPQRDADDVLLVALARAHRAGVVEALACVEALARARAAAHGALVLRAGARPGEFVLAAPDA
jgi:ribonuclease HII